MIRYTTPTITFSLPFEASYLTAAYITIVQRDITIDKSLDDCTASDQTLSVMLSQEETSKLKADRTTKIQLRCVGSDGKAYASQQFDLKVEEVLREGVIE